MPIPKGNRRGKGKGKRNKKDRIGFSDDADPFFLESGKKRRRDSDEIIDSDEGEDEDVDDIGEEDGGGEEASEEGEEETAAEKRYRIAKAQLDKVREITRKLQEEEGQEWRDRELRDEDEEDEEGDDDDEGQRLARKTDDLVADILQKEQLEKSGRARRLLASRIQKPEAVDKFRVLQRHRQPVTAVALNEDDSRGFSASKDGVIIHWDVETGAREKYLWPRENEIPSGIGKKQSKHVLALAVSSDGRYLATGGLDRLVHLWDTRTREHLQAFKGHRAPVSCLTFREGTPELFSGSFDNSLKWWNAADRTHLDNFFGHEAEVLTIDCLRKERVLSVGRDRTMRLFKVLESVSLRYGSPSASLECGCFINNEEFLSGSDDGSVELWSILRKKPLNIVKNAHSVSMLPDQSHYKEREILSNGIDKASRHQDTVSLAQSWVSSITVCKGSDLAASGAGNGIVRLWAIENEPRIIKPLYNLPLVGFVNSLAFAKSGRFILAGVGEEPRLGRWGRVAGAQNGVALFRLDLSEQTHHL